MARRVRGSIQLVGIVPVRALQGSAVTPVIRYGEDSAS